MSFDHHAFALCRECGHWTKLEVTTENYGNCTANQHCENCNSSRFDPQSVTSERTFDQARAKAKTNLVIKEKRI